MPDSFMTPESAMSSAGIHVASNLVIIERLLVTFVYIGIVKYHLASAQDGTFTCLGYLGGTGA